MDAPASINIVQFILMKHTILSIFFNRAASSPMRDRLFALLLITAGTIDVSGSVDEVIDGAGDATKAIGASVFVMTIVTFVIKNFKVPIAKFLNGCIPIVKEKLGIAIDEILIVGWCILLLYQYLTDSAFRASASGVALNALAAQYSSEFVSLTYQYAFCAKCCPCFSCCLPKTDDFGLTTV